MRLLTRTLKARSSALQLVAVAVVLAIGGNLVASYIWSSLGDDLSFWIGISAVILIVVVLARSEFRGLEECVDISGLMITNKGDVVDVPQYNLSSDMHTAFQAILNENEAIRNQWSRASLPSHHELGEDNSNQSVKLIREVMEFVLLDKLSGHLADSSLLRDDQIRAFERSDLLPLLPDNRVLDELTRPMDDRIALVRAQDGGSDRHFVTVRRLRYPGDTEGELWHATDGKHMYTRVSLELPKSSQVQRLHPGHIRIDSKYVCIDLYTEFQGMNANLDDLFITRYLGLPSNDALGEDGDDVTAWHVDFAIGTKIKLRGLLSPKAWKLYRWSETFVDACQKDFGYEEFYSAIGWAQTRTLLITQQNSPEYQWRRKASIKRDLLAEQLPGSPQTAGGAGPQPAP
jgi:hypothetical protein